MKAAIIMGSKSDYPVVEKAEDILKEFGVDYELRVLSAHRTPRQAEEFARTAEDRGVEVIIAAAGKAAHLAGVIAGNTPVPVIGIPMKTSDLGGMDSLLSVVQMPSGVPVSTVAINGAKNAALVAVSIFALSDPEIAAKYDAFRRQQTEKIINTQFPEK